LIKQNKFLVPLCLGGKKILEILLVGAKRTCPPVPCGGDLSAFGGSRYRGPACPMKSVGNFIGVKFFVENKRSLTRETYLFFLFNWGEFIWG